MMQSKINAFKEQINQSEKNLSAQNDVIIIKKKVKCDEVLRLAKLDHLNKLLYDCKLNVNELEMLTSRVIQSASRDNIAVCIIIRKISRVKLSITIIFVA